MMGLSLTPNTVSYSKNTCSYPYSYFVILAYTVIVGGAKNVKFWKRSSC